MAYLNSLNHRPCSLSSSGPAEYRRSSRAMTESSLFFTAGDFYPSVSVRRDNIAEPQHLLQFQSGIEGRLDNETNRQHNV